MPALSEPPVPSAAEPASAEPIAAEPSDPSRDMHPQPAPGSAQELADHSAPAAPGADAGADAPPPETSTGCCLQAASEQRRPGRPRKSAPASAPSQPALPSAAEPALAEPVAAVPSNSSRDVRPKRARVSAREPADHSALTPPGADTDTPLPAENQPAASGRVPVGGACQRAPRGVSQGAPRAGELQKVSTPVGASPKVPKGGPRSKGVSHPPKTLAAKGGIPGDGKGAGGGSDGGSVKEPGEPAGAAPPLQLEGSKGLSERIGEGLPAGEEAYAERPASDPVPTGGTECIPGEGEAQLSQKGAAPLGGAGGSGAGEGSRGAAEGAAEPAQEQRQLVAAAPSSGIPDDRVLLDAYSAFQEDRSTRLLLECALFLSCLSDMTSLCSVPAYLLCFGNTVDFPL